MSIKDFAVAFDVKAGLALGEYKTNDTIQAKAYGMCGSGYSCSGGGGQCGSSYECTGGGGRCGSSYECSGS